MKFQHHVTGLHKEICITLLALTVFMFGGIGRAYMVFLFHQLDLPGSKIVINDEQKSWIGSSLGLLSPIGCVLSGIMMDLFGRRLYFFFLFIPQIISWVIIALACSYEMLLLGMAIQGFGLGMAFCASTYISEISSPTHRGALLGLITITYNFGAVLTNTLMYFVIWTITAWIFGLLSLICMLCMLLLPESPAWLYSKGKKEASIQTLCSIRCANATDIKPELEDMEKLNIGGQQVSFIKLLQKLLGAWKPFLIVAVLQCIMQCTGYNIMFSYTILTFDRLRLPINSSKFAVGYSIAGVIGAAIAPYFMHRIKRKTLLTLSSSIMGLCVVVIGVYEEVFYDQDDNFFPHIVSVTFYAYAVTCNAGLLLIAYSVGSEVFPNEVRGVMNGLYGVITFLCWCVTLKFFPVWINIFHIKSILWFFAGSCFVITLYAIFILPETKGMTLNEVQNKYFQKRSTEQPVGKQCA